MTKWTFFTIVIILALIVWLATQAAAGSIAAWVILAAAGTVLLLLLGALIHHAGARISVQREQTNFAANTRENLDIMKTMIAAQNAQLTGALRSQRLSSQLEPSKNSGYPALPLMADSVVDVPFTIAGLDHEESPNQ